MTQEKENVESLNKPCYLCARFSGYYTKGAMQFVRTKLGHCNKHNKIVANIETCENWHNNYKRLYCSKKTSLRVLSDLLKDISGIRQILEEASEDMQKNVKS